jgi:hypothetical protein
LNSEFTAKVISSFIQIIIGLSNRHILVRTNIIYFSISCSFLHFPINLFRINVWNFTNTILYQRRIIVCVSKEWWRSCCFISKTLIVRFNRFWSTFLVIIIFGEDKFLQRWSSFHVCYMFILFISLWIHGDIDILHILKLTIVTISVNFLSVNMSIFLNWSLWIST